MVGNLEFPYWFFLPVATVFFVVLTAVNLVVDGRRQCC